MLEVYHLVISYGTALLLSSFQPPTNLSLQGISPTSLQSMPDDAHLPHADGIGSSLANAFSQASDQLSEDVNEHSSGQENAEVNEQVNEQISREVHDSQYEVCWSKIMDQGNYQEPITYTKVVALLFCWDDHCNDMETRDEVDRLRAVLEDDFNYKTQTEYLDSRPGLQVRVNARVANFVEANDGPNTLLIVYYAGHGRPGNQPGSLILTGLVRRANTAFSR